LVWNKHRKHMGKYGKIIGICTINGDLEEATSCVNTENYVAMFSYWLPEGRSEHWFQWGGAGKVGRVTLVHQPPGSWDAAVCGWQVTFPYAKIATMWCPPVTSWFINPIN
jgi:hypothetical protein